VPSGFAEDLDKHMLGPFDYCLQTGIVTPLFFVHCSDYQGNGSLREACGNLPPPDNE
jgi:hypothetical protein